jgi:hypothetical protein
MDDLFEPSPFEAPPVRLPRPRFTLWRMMVAVAVVAVLIPFPFEMVYNLTFAVLLVWPPIVLFALWIDNILARLARRLADVAVPCSVGVGVWLLGRYFSWVWLLSRYFSWDSFLPEAVFIGLTVANAAGPVYVARRVLRGEALAAGHLLWVWSGLVWSTLLLCPHPPHDRWHVIDMMVESSRLSLPIAVLLALYGPRPIGKGAAWGHHLGWALMECDVIAWGWFAVWLLRSA